MSDSPTSDSNNVHVGENTNMGGVVGENTNMGGVVGENINMGGVVGENTNKGGVVGENTNKGGVYKFSFRGFCPHKPPLNLFI